MAVIDPETGGCLFANAAAEHLGLTNLDRKDFVKIGPANAPGLKETLEAVARTHHDEPPSLYAATRDDKEIFVRVSVSLKEIADGRILLVHAEDVTAQVAVGEQHRRFLESANHQFRTPLSPIRVYADLIAQGEFEGEELREAAQTISVGAQRIERLLDRISALLRVQRDARQAGLLISVGELIGKLLRDHPDIERFVNVEGDLDLQMRCDPKPAEAALAELIENSKEHGIPPVSIAVEPTKFETCLRIWDQGPGPDLDSGVNLGNPWSPLSRPEVMPPEMGNRLGITFAHALATAAGGTLVFERDPRGWAYVLRLPSPDNNDRVMPLSS